jgi:hypothetical protein
MTPEEKELLRETAELTKENNKILRGIRRSNRVSTFLRLVYWIIILGSAFGVYYYTQPYIDAVVKSYNGMRENIQSVKNITTNLPALPDWMGGKQ